MSVSAVHVSSWGWGRGRTRPRRRATDILACLIAACVVVVAPVARSAPPPLEAYGQLPAIEMVTLSPAGDRIAYVLRDAKGTKIVARQVDGPVLMAAPVGDGFVDSVQWAGQDIVLVQLSNIIDFGGNSAISADAFALDLATKKVTQVLADMASSAPQIYDSFGIRNLQSGWFGFYGGVACPDVATTPCNRSLFKVDLQSGHPIALDHVDVSPGWVGQPDVAPQWLVDAAGAASARLIYDERNSRWRLVGIAGNKILSDGAAGFDGVSLWGLGRGGDSAAFVTRGDDGFKTLFEAPLAGGSPAQSLSKGHEVLGEWMDPETGRLVGYKWADDTWHDVMFDADLQSRADAAHAAFPKNLVQLTSASRDFTRFIAFTDAGDDSGSYWLLDFRTGQATQLGSAYPESPASETGAVSVFTYKAADGLPLEAVLTLPPGRSDAKGLPLVVLAHGGPERRERPGFDWLAQAFASRGYAVLAPNFRGSSGIGKAFRDAGFGQMGRKMQTDLSDGVDALAAAGVIDPKRVCIMGLDYGGYAAVAGVILQHGRYRCAVSFWGLFDLGDTFAHKVGGQDRVMINYWASFIGAGQADSNLSALSPVKQAAAADAPVLLVTTQPDWTRLIDQAPAMQAALQAAGKPVELTRIDSKDSQLRSAAVRTALLKAAVPFVEKHNPSGAD